MVYDLFDRGMQYDDDGQARVTTPEDNYARQASISYTQAGSKGGYFANAFDNSTSTYWRMAGTTINDTDITLDFQNKKTFTSIFLDFDATVTDGGTDTVFTYALQGSNDGTTWTVIETENLGAPTLTSYSFYAYGEKYRYLRLFSTRAAGNGTTLIDIKNFGVYK